MNMTQQELAFCVATYVMKSFKCNHAKCADRAMVGMALCPAAELDYTPLGRASYLLVTGFDA